MARSSSAFEFVILYTIFCILLTTHIAYAADGDMEESKPRRSGNMGLFPFPRVGRSDPEMIAYENVMNSIEDYDVPKYEMKRQGLIPFPRVGRARAGPMWAKIAREEYGKRTGGVGANGGLWFGPRLGRIQKRSPNHDDTIQVKSRHDIYTPRLGRESDELESTDYDELLTLLPNLKSFS
ncbi:cardio acceleratory peptide 2b isoform X1 [Phlebotomus argentipes]|uniref:cardio acceleratory peptide 2b isoform X1 n=1 Tax=Phlebotomus argentipes TaxID=94469 RepID=UPI002893698F|nr:cardio acceleratory peptide 2b isoform X1 [Phlebotomus argentipes]